MMNSEFFGNIIPATNVAVSKLIDEKMLIEVDAEL